jgi:hypothetical protein
MGRHNAFTFPYTFFREPAQKVIPELQNFGFTGINLALNYHASRDFLLRQGPELAYPADGFHYYQPNRDHYPAGVLSPNAKDSLLDNQMLDGVLEVAKRANFEINAWAVFMHNSALGYEYPEATVTNCFGNHFLSELCPSNPAVAGYIVGLTHDLSSRGIACLAIESLHFHGAHHGEHHERFFLEISPITGFLFSLCFCTWCIQNFSGDGAALKVKVAKLLQPWLDTADSWLGLALTKENLASIVGSEILDYLNAREELVARRYQEISEITKRYGVKTKFIDQAPLITGSEISPLELSWQIGIDNAKIDKSIDCYEPLIYRKSAAEVAAVAEHYGKNIQSPVTAILRPTFPDNDSAASLKEKVGSLRAQSITDIDFYLLDAMRPRDLKWIKQAVIS